MRGLTGRGGASMLGVAMVLMVGCTPPTGGEVQESVTPSGNLAATMQVETGADAVTLALHVTNVSGAPVEMEFSSGQRYDFQVTTEAGEILWTWSADKSFMQALSSETLAPGESLRYSETWSAEGRRGRFVGIGHVTSTNEPVRQSVFFDLTGEE